MQEAFNIVVLIIEFVGVGTVITLLKDFMKMRKEQKREDKKRAEDFAKIKEGQKCQLRSEMLRIYYHNKDDARIRQYELENFLTLYTAYKLLDGNSFIDRINEEVLRWEVIS